MTDTVVEKAAAVAPDLQSKAVELIDQLTAGLKAVAPQMADVTLAAVKLQAIYSLTIAALWTVACVVATVAALKIVRYAFALPFATQDRYHESKMTAKAVAYVAGGFVGLAVSLFLAVCNLCDLLSSTLWIAATDPRLALALRVINKLM